jgi:hypothetical protein
MSILNVISLYVVLEGKRSLERPKDRWENSINVSVMERRGARIT